MAFKRYGHLTVASGSTVLLAALGVLAFSTLPPVTEGPQQTQQGDERPSLSLRASPSVAFSSTAILFIAELRDGANDYEEYYCPSLEWDWDDFTTSETTYDCAPYEPGTSEIRRRYSARHTFQEPGSFQVTFRLRRGHDVLGFARTSVTVRRSGEL